MPVLVTITDRGRRPVRVEAVVLAGVPAVLRATRVREIPSAGPARDLGLPRDLRPGEELVVETRLRLARDGCRPLGRLLDGDRPLVATEVVVRHGDARTQRLPLREALRIESCQGPRGGLQSGGP